MTITVNGERHNLKPGATLADLAKEKNAEGRGCAMAVDGVVVPRSRWADATLEDGQHVELVQAVQGG